MHLPILLHLLLIVAIVNDATSANNEDNSTMQISQDVTAASDVIARFLGFKCPKGHRCLPVLECVPCDYGTYKVNDGSNLCQACPTGCTTLRKGAVSRNECIPKCPPGSEESKDGKTCSLCWPGTYKSSWKNVRCLKCPFQSTPDFNRHGMTKMRQCFGFTTAAPTPVQTTSLPTLGDNCVPYATCTKVEFDSERLRPLQGSNCTKFCQCSPASTQSNGTITYYWQEKTCTAGTLFDSSLPVPVCNTADAVTNCTDYTMPVPAAGNVTLKPEDGCVPNDNCTLEEHDYVRLKPLFNSNCTQFCQCATARTLDDGSSTFYWQEQTCAAGTLFDTSLLVHVCNTAANVLGCTDFPNAMQNSTASYNGIIH